MSTIFTKTGGISLESQIGGADAWGQESIDPDAWVTTLFRSLASYVNSVLDPTLYQVIMEFPSADDLGQYLPSDQTIIHFEADSFSHPILGFGDQIAETDVDNVNDIVTNYEVGVHVVNFDIGVWASSRSGGVTSRLYVYQILSDLFTGPSAYLAMQAAIGAEIQSFSAGSFSKEEINNLDVWRIIGMTLVVKVYGRKTFSNIPWVVPPGGYVIDPSLGIDDVILPND